MTSCGCSGTWTITAVYEGISYPISLPGFEFDAPFFRMDPDSGCLQGLSQNIVSACDGRVMLNRAACNSPSRFSQIVSRSFSKSDPNCLSGKRYDCLNGGCIEADQYGTPGIYQSLEECQGNCGASANQCPPNHVCLTNSEFSRISTLASQLKENLCG